VISAGDRVRRFIRFYAGRMAAMEPDPDAGPYPPTAMRVIDELACREFTELRSLRHALRIDPGQLSRTLARLEADGLVRRQPSTVDHRRLVVQPTPRGRDLAARYQARRDERIATMLAALSDRDQRRLVDAMEAARSLIEELVERGPHPDGFGSPRVGDRALAKVEPRSTAGMATVLNRTGRRAVRQNVTVLPGNH